MKLLPNKNRLIIFFIQIVLCSQAVLAQDYLFKIIASSGNCTLQKSGKANWDKTKIGAKLLSGDVIKLNDGSYIGLVSNSGKSLELKKTGTYNVQSLFKMLASGKNNVQKFTDYVINASVNQKSTNNMQTLGAVVRGKAEQIETLFPKETYLISPIVEAKWYSDGQNTTYLFKIINEQDRAVYIKEVKDTAYSIDVSPFNLEKEGKYKWVVESLSKKGTISEGNYFCLYTDIKIAQIKDSLAEYEKEWDKASAVDRFLKIAFYSQNSLNCNIITEYEEILKLASGVEDYQNSYFNFLIENGMKKRAEILLKNNK